MWLEGDRPLSGNSWTQDHDIAMSRSKHVLILGGGTGGTITANRLRRMLPSSIDITVIDSSDVFQWFYWHTLLPGHSIPGITSDMPTAGKHNVTVGAR